jgi:hypothetical protein
MKGLVGGEGPESEFVANAYKDLKEKSVAN